MSVYQSEMKVPIRPAPPPPVDCNQLQKTSKPVINWNAPSKASNSKVPVSKKKPPPRPPPPKFPNSKQEKKQIPTRPSQLITSLFHRKNNSAKCGDQLPKPEVIDSKGNNVLSLIDFNSPPSSPTFTTRSSSDALSVNSFGSDGITPCSTSSGNASNVESGFEDDFDLLLASVKKRETHMRDPWSTHARPDQSWRQKNPSPLQNQKSNPIGGGSGSSASSFPLPGCRMKNGPGDVSAMPTIIRVKPERPKSATKVNANDVASNVSVLAEIFGNSNETFPSSGNAPFVGGDADDGDDGDEDDDDDGGGDDDDGWSSESPPMPTCPPPAPPPEILQGLFEKDSEITGASEEKARGVAIYDFKGEHPGDLSFKEKDVVNLVRRIDDNWYVGEIGGREGTVPANFISVRVPLREDGSDRRVIALYPFRAETWDDLEFQEGSPINVLGRINQDWLYGEFNGRTGQFPANFVDRVPPDLPLRRN